MWGIAGCMHLMTLLLLGQLDAQLDPTDLLGDRRPGEAILEMLQIGKLSGQRRGEPHPYMTHIYQLLDSQEAADPSGSDGTLVQSFRSLQGSQFGPPGWIWFDVSRLKPSMSAAELVLLRRRLYPESLRVSVAVYAASLSGPTLDERPLALDRLPPSGYDVFDVSAALAWARGLAGGPAGFRLRYTDESGSLELHEALTQSLYCLNASAQSQPLLVAYRLGRPPQMAPSSQPTLHHRCGSALRRQTAPPASHCRLHTHYVDLQQLPASVLQPRGFSFSFCSGTCSHGNPREDSRDRREWDVNRDDGFRSECLPQHTSAITVMYRSDADDIEIARLANTTATGCRCRGSPSKPHGPAASLPGTKTRTSRNAEKGPNLREIFRNQWKRDVKDLSQKQIIL